MTGRETFMSPADFAAAGQKLYGGKDWQWTLADALGLSRTTVWRYARGDEPVPYAIALLMKFLAERFEAGATTPVLRAAGHLKDRRFAAIR